MPDVTLRGAVDTWVNQARDSKNFNGTRQLGMALNTAYAFLYFNRPMPLGAVVTSAKLRVYHSQSWSGTTTITAARLAEPLKAARVTWNKRPLVTGASASVTDTGGPQGKLVELDVKPLLQAVADGAPWHGFRLSTSGSMRKVFSSEGPSAYRPTLTVEWSEAPQAPTGLTPGAGKAVAVPKPLLRFRFTDKLGDTTLSAVRVQVASNDTFSGAWDSGWVTSDMPELDLSATSYPGIPSGGTVYWRAQVRDGAGLESTWSDDAAISYEPPGTVSVLNPPPGAGSTVADPTPRIVWSFSGTQRRWQVLILDANDPTVEIADSGEQSGTDTAWTPPDKKALRGTGPYRVLVRVWDDKNRDASAGYAESAPVDFTVVNDPTVAGVVGLAASQPNPWPGVVLTWTRSSAPDSYVVVRDGITLEPELLPEDALVSGTSYRWVDPGARTWRPHTWQVKAKVNGKQSNSVSVTHTPTTRGIWLLDEANGRRVWLAGSDQGSWTRPEDASSIAPLGASQSVRRVQGTRNYEGSISGQLVDAHGRSAASYEADLEAIRKAGKPVQLAVADLNLRVLLGNVQTAPTQHIPPSRLVAFDFWEVS